MGEGIPLPLAGVGVGNGLTDPEVQYGFYPQMAISTNGHEPAVGTLTYSAMKLALPACLAAIRACNRANVTLSDAICAAAQAGCNMAEIAPYQLSGMNVYDMRIPCDQSAGGLCYDFSNIKAFLSRPEVLEYLGVGEDRAAWTDCNMEVNARFQGDWMKDYQQQLPDLLAAGIRVLIYAGDQVRACRLGPHARAQRPLTSLVHASGAAGLHLQLAGQQGVDARAAVGGQGGVQWRVRSAVVRARRHRPFAARGGCAHRQGPHVPPRVRRGPHGAHGPARRVARHARSVPCRQTRMNAPGHCRLRPLCADMRQPGRN